MTRTLRGASCPQERPYPSNDRPTYEEIESKYRQSILLVSAEGNDRGHKVDDQENR